MQLTLTGDKIKIMNCPICNKPMRFLDVYINGELIVNDKKVKAESYFCDNCVKGINIIDGKIDEM